MQWTVHGRHMLSRAASRPSTQQVLSIGAVQLDLPNRHPDVRRLGESTVSLASLGNLQPNQDLSVEFNGASRIQTAIAQMRAGLSADPDLNERCTVTSSGGGEACAPKSTT